MGIQDLREKRTFLKRKVRDLVASANYGPKEQAEVVELHAKIDEADDEIARIERSLRDAFAGTDIHNAPNPAQANVARLAFANALRYGLDRIDPDERAMVAANAPGNRGRVRNVAEGVNTAGGYMVPTLVMPELLKKLKAIGGCAPSPAISRRTAARRSPGRPTTTPRASASSSPKTPWRRPAI